MFRALVLEKEGDAAVAHLRDLDESALPPGDVTVAVEYSTLNYKDGLALSANGGGIVRTWPHVAGIDFAGVVEASSDRRYKPGDKVILTGWRVGEVQRIVIGGQPRRLFIAGTWRDYARQWGAIILPLNDYRRFTGDATATEAAFDLQAGAEPQAVQQALQAALPAAVQGQAQFGRPAEMRRVALTIFDRSFAVTYALEAIAIIIGLIGVATSFSA